MQENEYIIDARKLKSILGNQSDFSAWIKTHIKSNNLIENKDFIIKREEIKALRNKATKTNYFLNIDVAQQIIFKYRKNKIAKKIKENLESGIDLDIILGKIDKENEKEIKIIKIEDEEYPKQLKKIKNPPKQLYVKGNISNLQGYGIALIGTRDCSIYGRTICRKFAKEIVGYNLNIISGLAVGIDACAHKACIEANGKTIAVLPSGFNNIFPKENVELANRIVEKGGTVITEYPPDFEKTQESCKERNRIVSGLAIGTLVVEAKKRSGTSITVGHTIEQNKKVFCIPSSLFNSKGIGTNLMIKQNKAKLVIEIEDIIKEYPELKLERKKETSIPKAQTSKTKSVKVKLDIEEENMGVYKILSKEPIHINQIVELTKQPLKEILYKLTMLEIQGAIEELPGKRFKTK